MFTPINWLTHDVFGHDRFLIRAELLTQAGCECLVNRPVDWLTHDVFGRDRFLILAKYRTQSGSECRVKTSIDWLTHDVFGHDRFLILAKYRIQSGSECLVNRPVDWLTHDVFGYDRFLIRAVEVGAVDYVVILVRPVHHAGPRVELHGDRGVDASKRESDEVDRFEGSVLVGGRHDHLAPVIVRHDHLRPPCDIVKAKFD